MPVASFILDVDPARQPWCAYQHSATLQAGQPPQPVFVAICKLADVFRFIEAKQNSKWLELFNGGGQLLCEILATGERAEVSQIALAAIKEKRPLCNLQGMNMRTARRAVTCLENGQTYETQQQAALELGISQSAISQQLTGRLKTAAGYRFVYAVPRPTR